MGSTQALQFLAGPAIPWKLLKTLNGEVLGVQGLVPLRFYFFLGPWTFTWICSAQLPYHPKDPSRHPNAARQKLTPHCLAAIFDFQLHSPKLSLKMPRKFPLCQKRGSLSSFRIDPVMKVTARQLSVKNCLGAIFVSRHLDVSPGPSGHPCKNGTHSTCFYSTGGHTPKVADKQTLGVEPEMGKIANRQQAIPQFHVERMLNE